VSVPTSDDAVVVRMYNVGFGDAFLLQFPGEKRPRRVLIDCGSHFLGAGPRPIKEIVEQIIGDVTDADGVARIDIVVGTHRHQDHVSGFAEPAWADVVVGEVWMPWTENPSDPEARDVLNAQSSTAHRLKLGLTALDVDAEDPALVLAENALTNAPAMRTLHRGFSGDPVRRFLSSDSVLRPLDPDVLPGVRIHVLGPARSQDIIRDMTPPAGESYVWLTGADAAYGEASPFAPDWELSVEEFAGTAAFSGLQALEKGDRERIARHGETDALSIAVRLEAAVNGTSLFLAFEIGEAVLLFPGDAQWGTWRMILDDETAMEVLKRTTFLKVGHHGSHNATPVAFVKALAAARTELRSNRDAWAMVSTRPIKIWKQIPKTELLEALGKATDHLARSDETVGPRPDGFSAWDDSVVEATVPTR
jgi:beta-lactamase superfamily II metal-dependent hydrolase